jgi:hypothetical protein
MKEYTVNLHVHTTFSDGEGTMEEVISAAQKAGLDILLINDHDTLKGKKKGYEGYYGNLLVLIGCEFSGRHNHYLSYGLDHYPGHDFEKPQEFIDIAREQGAVGFIAHPFEKGSPFSEQGRAYTWTDWNVTGYDGICIWNYSSIWKSRVLSITELLKRYFLRAGTLPGPEKEVLAKWDETGQTRRVAAVCGSDAHALKKGFLFFKLKFFPYKYLFRAINTHLLFNPPLTNDLDTDRALVFKALAKGSSFLSHDKLGDTAGFDFRVEKKGREQAGQGEEIKFSDGDRFIWALPQRATVNLIKDGEMIFSLFADQGSFQVPGPGVYRIEVEKTTRFFGLRPWIFSNHIYIRD